MTRLSAAGALGALAVCASAPTSAGAATIVDIASFLLEFQNAGFAAPTITMNETETTFELSIIGSLVDHTFGDNSGSFTAPIILDFWRGTVTFSQVDGFFVNDSVTASMALFHQAGISRPHPDDDLKGGIYTFPASVLQVGNPPVVDKGTVDHPKSHQDKYNARFSVTGKSGSITGWNFTLKATHAPEPSTWALLILGFGLAGAGLRRARAALAV